MCAMLLADMGATVLRIDRRDPVERGNPRPLKYNLVLRNRRTITLDLKRGEAVEFVLRLVERADVLMEGFRPGVTERLGLGPDACLTRNARLVYGRATGWGQGGPLASAVGHDLNYIALTGALHAIGRRGDLPAPPLNLLGDFAGGSLYLAMGMLAALLEARTSGKGQVVDAAIVDGAASLMTAGYGLYAAGIMTLERGSNNLDSGRYYYDSYTCADGLLISVAAIEARFHAELLRLMDIDPTEIGEQRDPANWPKARAIFATKFLTRTRAEWCAILEGSACVAPVLSMKEAPEHPHMRARGTFVEIDGVVQPAPAPRFSRTKADMPLPPQEVNDANTEAALAPWITPDEMAALRKEGTLVP